LDATTASNSGQIAQATRLNIGTDEGEPFSIDANVLATGRTCILGSSGSGKSYAVGVMCEELCKNGVPFAIVDTEGEYSGLKEKYEVIWVGDDDRADLKWGQFGLKELAAQAPNVSPLVLDVSASADRNRKISAMLADLYDVVDAQRVPYLVIVEEADKFIPQSGDKLPIFYDIAQRGRKRGLGLLVSTQRPSVVDKNVLSQCGNQLIGKLVIRNDLQAVSQFFPSRELPKQLTTLGPGDFYALGGLSPNPRCIHIRQRETKPGGVTPEFVPRKIMPLQLGNQGPATIQRSITDSGATPSSGGESREILAGQRTQEQFVTGAESQAPQVSGTKNMVPQEQTTLLGIPFAVKPDEVASRVKRQKSSIFGQREVLTEVQPVYRELLELSIQLRKGILTKRFETKYTLLDSGTQQYVEVGKKLALQNGLGSFVGLSEVGIQILRHLSDGKYSSPVDVADKMRISSDNARGILQELERRRLVRSSQMGRVNVYQRITKVPDLVLKDTGLIHSDVEMGNALYSGSSVTEDQLREVVRGLNPDYELTALTRLVYPLYRVGLALANKTRTIWVDGVTGEETDLVFPNIQYTPEQPRPQARSDYQSSAVPLAIPKPPHAPMVFISHCSKDAALRDILVKTLRDNGLDPWVAEERLGLGQSSTEKVKASVRDCNYFVVLYTKANPSDGVKTEVGMAQMSDKKIIPIVEKGTILDFTLQPLDRIEFVMDNNYSDFERACRKVADTIAMAES
jgi:uncharacterized protein